MLVGRPPYETSEVKKTYERIKRNAYSFPDYVPLSEHSKNLVSNLLVLDPCKMNISNNPLTFNSKKTIIR